MGQFVGLLALSVTAIGLRLQESERELGRQGAHHKHLTTDTVDRWRLTARSGEVLCVDVSSSEFDPVLELVRSDGTAVVDGVDDEGSASNFLVRLDRDGTYEILVHGPGRRGGGNYRLYVERFLTKPLGEGRALSSNLGQEGIDHVRFAARTGEILVPTGAPVAELLDPTGNPIADWGGSYAIAASGEHFLRLRGLRGQAYHLRVLAARRRNLEIEDILTGVSRAVDLPPRGMDIWEFPGHADDFRFLEIDWRGHGHVRVVPRGEDEGGSGRHAAILSYPMHSKADLRRHAFVLGRDGRFQIQVLSTGDQPSRYRLTFGDPTSPAFIGSELVGRLPIGGVAFHAFEAHPGQLVEIIASSDAFDPWLTLRHADGTLLAQDDDGGGDLSCRIAFFVSRAGLYRLQVSSYGDGGGGPYRLEVRELSVPAIAVGESREQEVGGPGASYWHFDGEAGRTVIISLSSATMDMAGTVYDPAGGELGGDDDSGLAQDALWALRLPRDGRYTVVATAKSGRGVYRIQILTSEAFDSTQR